MSRFLVVLVAILLVPGCQAKPKTTAAPQAATTPEAATAPDPVLINVVTNQAVVYSCPQCGMDFEKPGQCSMCHVDLVKTAIAYICPADNKPVEHSGQCPRCVANAEVRRTAMIPPALGGN